MSEMIDRCVSAVRSKELTQYKDIVIEVIKNMREPTDKIEAVHADSITYSSSEIWQMMIDSILNDN